jgi:hypothetical protein
MFNHVEFLVRQEQKQEYLYALLRNRLQVRCAKQVGGWRPSLDRPHVPALDQRYHTEMRYNFDE